MILSIISTIVLKEKITFTEKESLNYPILRNKQVITLVTKIFQKTERIKRVLGQC